MARNNYAVLGLGSFGTKLALELSEAGNNVLVCDISRQRIDEIRDKIAEVIIADVTHEDTIKELNVRKFDAVIVGMSNFFERQVLALSLLKQEGARRILVKATNDMQEKILYRLGADEVIQPDQDVAERLSRRLSLVNISDIFDFKGSAIADVVVPENLADKSLKELNLRATYNITVLLLRKPDSTEELQPGPETVLERGDSLTVFGDRQAIIDLFKEK